MIWAAPRMWDGGTCFIIGGGPSIVKQFDVPADVVAEIHSRQINGHLLSPYMKPLHSKHVIGVNNAYTLGPWVDCCFFGDCSWYLVHRLNLAKFSGLKVTCCPRFLNRPESRSEGIKYLAKDNNAKYGKHGISRNPSAVRWNHNSGAAAINLAVHFGARKIVLLGFDMKLDSDQVSHWHKSHGNNRRPPFARHMRGFPVIAEHAKALGVEIINTSMDSAIECFPKVELHKVLDRDQ